MTIIKLDIKDCRECPKCGNKLTKGFGYATDYFCTLNKDKITSGYVEWERDINPIPDWCPLIENPITNKHHKCFLDHHKGFTSCMRCKDEKECLRETEMHGRGCDTCGGMSACSDCGDLHNKKGKWK